MSITDLPVLQAFIRICNDGWLQGWHERNGGNLTYRMQEEEVIQCRPFMLAASRDWVEMGVEAANLAGEYFLATGSGKYFRNVVLAPGENIGIVEINERGNAWRIVWGLEKGAVPTSEFPSHFMNHSVRKTATGGTNRIIYHAHTPAVIALTYILPLSAKAFTRALWQSATECPVVFPGGIGIVEWMTPGGANIAKATSKTMQKYEATIWAHHGLFCSGPDFDTAFGLMHTIEKAADVYLRVLSAGQPVRQTISDENLKEIAEEFQVQLNTEFLD